MAYYKRLPRTHRQGAMSLAVVSVLGLIVLAVSGVPSAFSSVKTTHAASTHAATNPCAGKKRYWIYYATHAFPHPFFTPMEHGAIAGAKAACLKVTWTQSPQGYDLAETVTRMQAAIAQHPDVLVVAVPDPQAEDATIRKAIAAGIKVIEVNAKDGRPQSQQPAYLSYVGITDETQTGIAAANQILAVNPHPAFAVVANSQPGDPELTNRVTGFMQTMKAAGVKTDQVDVHTNTAQALQTYLVAHPQTDALYTLSNGSNGSAAARQVIKNLGRTSKIALVSTDYDITDLQAIKAGAQVAAIDQQQYLQGYLPAVIARLYLDGGQAPTVVSTGPGVINKKNVNQVIAQYKKGNR